MPSSDIAFLIFIVAAFTLFGGALAFASFEEARARRKPHK